MNCSQWNRYFSDYIDGTLDRPLQQETESHLKTCSKCKLEMGQFNELREIIAQKTPKISLSPKPAGKRWENAPWFIRSGVEGMGVAAIVLGVVLLVPRLRGFYEQNLEKRLSAFDIADIVSDQSVPGVPGSKSGSKNGPNCSASTNGIPSPECIAPMAQSSQTDIEGLVENPVETDSETEETATEVVEAQPEPINVTVGNSEIWRFEIKTESPQEIKPWLTQTLMQISGAKTVEEIGQNEVPGGIQYDLTIAKESVLKLKEQLDSKIKPISLKSAHSGNALRNSITWFKKKAREGIPAGKTRVVVWISQI